MFSCVPASPKLQDLGLLAAPLGDSKQVILMQLVTDYCRFLAIEGTGDVNAIPDCPHGLNRHSVMHRLGLKYGPLPGRQKHVIQ